MLGGEAFFSGRVKVTLGEWILGVTCWSGECCQNLVPLCPVMMRLYDMSKNSQTVKCIMKVHPYHILLHCCSFFPFKSVDISEL